MADAAVKRARAGQGSIRDRLSALPDELLLRVLSFLPAQQVVRTTVLSKRWADLWRSVPGINLDYFGFGSDWERMVYFVDNLLMLHRAPCLDAFRLVATVGGHHRHIDTWVRRAIRDDPLVIQINLGSSYRMYQLPYLSSSPCRRLTNLHLHGISLDHSFAERLHSWWPQLKDLTLINCRTVFSGIESDKLENLVLLNCIHQPGDVFAIKASHLASLSVLLHVPFTLDAGNSLVTASISLNCAEFCSRDGAILLSRLSNVTSLDLDGFQRMAALDKEFDDVPVFHNLRTLSLGTYATNNGTSDVCELKAVGRFLHKSPNLEKLTLKHFKVVLAVEHVDFPILENLRTLSLHYCDLHDSFQILLHCLWNSPNLEKVNITSCKLTDDPMGGKQKAKSKKTYSQSTNLARFQCLKLEYAEIIRCQEDAGVHDLVSFLLDVAASTVTIKVAKSLDCLPALP